VNGLPLSKLEEDEVGTTITHSPLRKTIIFGKEAERSTHCRPDWMCNARLDFQCLVRMEEGGSRRMNVIRLIKFDNGWATLLF
jgi:hypothetical protein